MIIGGVYRGPPQPQKGPAAQLLINELPVVYFAELNPLRRKNRFCLNGNLFSKTISCPDYTNGLKDNKRNKVLKLMFSGQSVGTVIVGDVG